jgi:hypothetical protein
LNILAGEGLAAGFLAFPPPNFLPFPPSGFLLTSYLGKFLLVLIPGEHDVASFGCYADADGNIRRKLEVRPKSRRANPVTDESYIRQILGEYLAKTSHIGLVTVIRKRSSYLDYRVGEPADFGA